MSERTPRRPPAKRGATSRQAVQATERQAEAMRYRRDGLTFVEIGERMGVSDKRARELVQLAMDRIIREPGQEVIDLELARLDALWAAAWNVLERFHFTVSYGKVMRHPETGDLLGDDGPILSAIDRLVRISESRRKLLGVDAPTRTTVTVITEDAVDAAIRQLNAELEALDDGSADRGAAGETAGAASTSS